MKDLIGRTIGIVLCMAALTAISLISLSDLNDAITSNKESKNDKNSGNSNGSGSGTKTPNRTSSKSVINIKSKEKSAKNKVVASRKIDDTDEKISMSFVDDKSDDTPIAEVKNIGGSSIISVDRLGTTEIISREPFFKHSDAAERFLSSLGISNNTPKEPELT